MVVVTVPAVPTLMWNARFCQSRSLSTIGVETVLQFGWLGMQPVAPAIAPRKLASCTSVANPDGWFVDVVIDELLHAGGGGTIVGSQPGGGVLALGAPPASNSTPAEAVVSFDATVLLIKSMPIALWMEIPPPAHPATLLAMMLLVTLTLYAGH